MRAARSAWTLGRWGTLHALRQPLTWLWLATALAIWPWFALLAPRALMGGSSLEAGLIYEVAFISLSVGALVGAHALDRADWFLGPLGALERLIVELAVLGAVAAVVALPALLAPLAGLADLRDLPLRMAFCHLHLSALTLVLSRFGWGSVPRATALLVAVWLLPALPVPDTFSGRFIESTFAAGDALTLPAQSVPTAFTWKARLTSIIGLIGAALLLRPPSAPCATAS